MKFCSKCGKELMDEAVMCPACGCLVNEKSTTQQNGVTVVKTSKGRLFGSSMLGGLIFGFIMGVFVASSGGNFFAMFILGGLAFGLLFYALMAIFVSTTEKKTLSNIRQKVSIDCKVYFEGAANREGNGGWLFVTEKGVEHHPHQMNFNSNPTIITHDDIVSIRKTGKKLSVFTSKNEYEFVVSDVNKWISLFQGCELTRQKVSI